SLYHDSYEDILVVIEDRTTCPMPEGPMRVAERYVTFVETNDEDVKLLGHFDGPLSKFGPFDLLIQTPQSLSHDFSQL
ncbi:MAG: hypothetical protein P8N43_01130, partial [Alphaproteobacteria bacterium]|nr:hypothetical protein [Alphaproteobacteria bacterium]